MFKSFILAIILLSSISTVYKFKVASIDGDTIDFEQFKGKKILLVNIATESKYLNQLYNLEKLYQKYKDNLAVIVVPSNSFGHEKRSNAEIKELIRDYYSGHFLISEKMEVTGPGGHPLFKWLSKNSENEIMNIEAGGDFHKYLVGSDGRLIGYFVSGVDPLDSYLQKTIEDKILSQ